MKLIYIYVREYFLFAIVICYSISMKVISFFYCYYLSDALLHAYHYYYYIYCLIYIYIYSEGYARKQVFY